MQSFSDVEEFLENRDRALPMTAENLYHHWKALQQNAYTPERGQLGRVLILNEPGIGTMAEANVYDALGKILETEPPIEDTIAIGSFLPYTPFSRTRRVRSEYMRFLKEIEVESRETGETEERRIKNLKEAQEHAKENAFDKIVDGVKNATPSGNRTMRFHLVPGEEMQRYIDDLK